MKTSIIILIFCLIIVLGMGQKTATVISCERTNFLFVGMQNPISALIEKCPWQSVYLSSNNGIITNNWNGHFQIIPDTLGLAVISLYKTTKKDTIFIRKYTFRVKECEDIDVIIYGIKQYRGGKITKSELAKATFLHYNFEDFFVDLPILYQFRCGIFRNDSIIFLKSYDNPTINEELKNFIRTLEKGDIVLFDKIYLFSEDSDTKSLKRPIEFEIL